MKRYLSIAILSTFLLGIASCDKPETVTLTIFHTNDIHSNLHAPKADGFQLGGLARMATLLKTLRQARPLSITVDAGDWSEGSWHFSLDTGANMLRLFNEMQYDAVVVGNHDYLVGPDRMIDFVTEAAVRFPVLASNLDFSQYQRKTEFQKAIPPTAIIERGGLKIGFIGLTTIDYPFASYLKPLVAIDPIADAQAQAKKLRPLVDVLIIISHNTISVNEHAARVVPGVDAVISGHSHRKLAKAILVDNAGRKVPVVETGNWGRFLGDLRLTIDKKSKVVEFEGYELHAVTEDLEEDAKVAEMIRHEDERLSAFYGDDINRPVAHCEADLDHDDAHHATIGDIAVKAYRNSVPELDAAIEMLKLTGISMAEGDVTIKDLHDVMPHILNWQTKKEWTIKVWNARAQDLGLVMNVFYLGNVLPMDHTGFIAVDNMEVVWQPKGQGVPVPLIKSIKIGGQPLDQSRRYKVGLTDGMLTALTIANDKFSLGMDLANVQDTGIEGWRAVIAYGLKVKSFNVDSLREGGRSYTTTPDLAVFTYGVKYQNGALRVQVANDGLQPSEEATLVCQHGLANNPVAYNTELQSYTKIGEAAVASLAPGQAAVASIAWSPDQAGYWPVSCHVSTAVDGYAGNNSFQKVMRVGL